MKFSVFSLFLVVSSSRAFTIAPSSRISTRSSTKLYTEADADVIDVEAEDVEPGTMRVAEIKSELDLRGIEYIDCFDKESLAQKLVQARASGKADPSIIDQFNEQRQKEEVMDIEDDILNKATGGDGTLPGGMPPDMLKQLMGTPEVMELLSNPKMQEVMTIMMEGGQDAIEVAMIEDKEVYELVTKLNEVMGKAM